jgi:hypothetical protein
VPFNLVTRGDVQGIPLIEMTTADFVRPIVTGITANFSTGPADAARRRQLDQSSQCPIDLLVCVPKGILGQRFSVDRVVDV